MSRNFVQKAELIEPEAQSDCDRKIESIDWLLEMAGQEKIELRAPAKYSERQFGGERGISDFDPVAELGMQHVTGVCAFLFDAAQDFKGDLSGRGDTHKEIRA